MLKTTKDLDTEIAKIHLSVKKSLNASKLPDFSINVKLLADVSGSFKDEYQDGLVDPFFDAAFSIAQVVDPDKTVQIIAFSDASHDTGDYSTNDFRDVKSNFLSRVKNSVLWQGTDYALALLALLNSRKSTGISSWFSKPKSEPTLVLFLTDGEDYGNRSDFIKYMKKLVDDNCFVICIGANNNKSMKFDALQEVADLNGVTFHRLSDLSALSTDMLYDRVFDTEFVNWYNQL